MWLVQVGVWECGLFMVMMRKAKHGWFTERGGSTQSGCCQVRHEQLSFGWLLVIVRISSHIISLYVRFVLNKPTAVLLCSWTMPTNNVLPI